MNHILKYKIAWLLIFICIGLIGYNLNNQYWVSFIEALIYLFSSENDSEVIRQKADIYFICLSLILIISFLLIPKRYGLWVSFVFFGLMVALLLMYFPFKYNNNPELGFWNTATSKTFLEEKALAFEDENSC